MTTAKPQDGASIRGIQGGISHFLTRLPNELPNKEGATAVSIVVGSGTVPCEVGLNSDTE